MKKYILLFSTLVALLLATSTCSVQVDQARVESEHFIYHAKTEDICLARADEMETAWARVEAVISPLKDDPAHLHWLPVDNDIFDGTVSGSIEDLEAFTGKPIDTDGGPAIIDSQVILDAFEASSSYGAHTYPKLGLTFMGIPIPFVSISLIQAPEDADVELLAHELVHYRLTESWDPLPITLEEGLAEWVSIQAYPDQAEASRESHIIGCQKMAGELPYYGKGFQATYQAAHTQDLGSLGMASAYNLGWLLVSSIIQQGGGVQSLLDLCHRAAQEGHEKIPLDWVTDELGITADEKGIAELLERLE